MNIDAAYRLLRLPKGAGLEEVKRAFRKLAFDLHPDLHPDNPQAGKQFQRLNEAYVLLKQLLEEEGQADKAKAKARTANNGGFQSERTRRRPSPPPPPPRGDAGEEAEARTREQKASQAYRRAARQAGEPNKEEVLNEILRDPFARQVFEDIYSEIRRGGKPVQSKPAKPRRRKRLNLEWGDKNLRVDMSQGLWGGIKGWLRGQLDEERVMRLEPDLLRPGTKIRLQLRHGLGREVRSVEVVLPEDYAPGRAVRLKGLGRRLGPWSGDLYLRLLAASPLAPR